MQRASVGPIKLSVVIPTFNRQRILERTLPLLLAQDFPPEKYEVIVTVDGATDSSAEMMRSMVTPCRIKVIEQARQGAAAARNAGAAVARGSLLLFLDDDILCPVTLISAHFAAHSGDRATVTHGPIFVAPESPRTLITCGTRQWYETYNRQLTTDKSLDVSRQGFLISNTCMNREFFLACGGFDPTMVLLEDTELGIRLAKCGARFTYLPNAIVQEIFSKSTRSYFHNDAPRHGKAEIALCRKHPDYRHFSALNNLGSSTVTRRVLRKLAIRSSGILQGFLSLLVSILERPTDSKHCRRAGLFLLGVSYRLMFLRSAAHEVGSYRALIRQYGMRLPVLLYHHVGPSRPGTLPDLTLSPEKFERHVRWLARRGFVGIRPSDWLRWLRDGTGLPDKPILLTFDDGYADIADYALPVLRRHGFSAAVYIVTGQLGGTNAWDEAQGSGTHRLMTAEQIRYWAAQGIEFGAHSRTHADLTKLSAAELAAEISGSKNDLASVLGSTITSFTYPYGELSEAVSEFARGEFDLAFTTERGLNYLRTDPHLLRRINISPNDSLIDIECHTHWAELQHLSQLRARLKVRSRLKRAARVVLRRQ
jgi:peptidoglycan/xylan/chitin deacetylase (PgdA/CDA1 family)/GT2 family glycosyltransferase